MTGGQVAISWLSRGGVRQCQGWLWSAGYCAVRYSIVCFVSFEVSSMSWMDGDVAELGFSFFFRLGRVFEDRWEGFGGLMLVGLLRAWGREGEGGGGGCHGVRFGRVRLPAERPM